MTVSTVLLSVVILVGTVAGGAALGIATACHAEHITWRQAVHRLRVAVVRDWRSDVVGREEGEQSGEAGGDARHRREDECQH